MRPKVGNKPTVKKNLTVRVVNQKLTTTGKNLASASPASSSKTASSTATLISARTHQNLIHAPVTPPKRNKKYRYETQTRHYCIPPAHRHVLLGFRGSHVLPHHSAAETVTFYSGIGGGDLVHFSSVVMSPHDIPPPGYVTSHELYELDKKLRKRYCLFPRADYHAFCSQLYVRRIKYIPAPKVFRWWNVEHFYAVFIKMYEKHGNACSRLSTASRSKSHLIATPAILADPNYLPLKQATHAAGVNPRRIGIWVTYMTILPYYDPVKKRLLYPVDKLREKSMWRPLNFIRKHLGEERANKISTTAEKKLIMLDGYFHHWLYHVPELSHL